MVSAKAYLQFALQYAHGFIECLRCANFSWLRMCMSQLLVSSGHLGQTYSRFVYINEGQTSMSCNQLAATEHVYFLFLAQLCR